MSANTDGTGYRGLHACNPVLLPLWLVAHTGWEGRNMGEIVLQGTAATGENNVCGRLCCLLYCRELENNTNEMAQSERRQNIATQSGGTKRI